MPENWIRGRKYGSEKLGGTMISGSQLFAAESSWFEKNTEFKNNALFPMWVDRAKLRSKSLLLDGKSE